MTTKEQLADVAAGLSVATFLGMTLGQWETIINITAGIIAIIAGGAAAIYHILRVRNLRAGKQ